MPFVRYLLNLYPDFLWFDQFQLAGVWLFVFFAKWKVFFITYFLALIFFLLNNFIVKKVLLNLNQAENPTVVSNNVFLKQLFEFLKQALQKNAFAKKSAKAYDGLLRLMPFAFALLLALYANGSWERIYAFFHQVPFGEQDPVFSKDLSFYFFSLPFIEILITSFFLLLVFSFGLSFWQYLSRGVLLYIFSGQLRQRAIKIHLFFYFSLFCLYFAGRVFLAQYNLMFSDSGLVFGAGYSDLIIVLPVLKILFIVLLIVAVIFLISAFSRFIIAPFFLLALCCVFYFLAAVLLPGFVQNYIVAPNELEKEKPYINRSIKYTRLAYDLDRVKSEQFNADLSLNPVNLSQNKTTLDNIRLWNQEPLQQTFSQLQEIRLYYEFFNIDVDRYMVNGVPQQVMLSPRELDPLQLPSQAQTWINKRLVYTHGYGLCMSPVNEISKEGLPKFYIKDIPPKSFIDLKVTRPEIYFGEKTGEYIIVNTNQKEFDYPKGDSNVYSQYQGKGGIVLDSFLKRLFFSIKFSDIKILISSLIKSDSRLLFDRQISTMVRKVAPFLYYDADPYLVVSDEGRLFWMMDAYTYSDRYPYSDPYKGYFNYIRNAVKISVDAYSGEMNFYVMDKNDPIIATLEKMYRGLFKPFKSMPDDLKSHIRYPKDLFTIQAEVYSTYHMTDAQVFYNREDLWKIPQEQYGENQQVMKAYYMVTKLPGDQSESFIQMLPFNPTNKNNMIAWMSVKCDPADYGQLRVYKFPKDKTIYGPMQIESRIDQDTEISQKLTLWGQVGSRVIRGNLMVVPIESSLVYVEPIYLQATQSKLPELKRVIFSYGDQIVMSENLNKSLDRVFNTGIEFENQIDLDDVSKDVESSRLRKELNVYFSSLKKAAAEFNWGSFGDALNKIESLLKK